MKRTSLQFASMLVLLASVQAQTQNSYPMLMSVHPVAVQAGQSSEHVVSARYNLHGAYQVLVSGQGVTAEVAAAQAKEGENRPPGKPNTPKIKVRFTAAADALPGPRDFRLATPQGVSTVGQLVVVLDPVVSESADNNTPAKAQPISIPATICGAIEAPEDVDCFKFSAEAGTCLTFHVRSQRLEDRIHDLQEHIDPILTLRSLSGNTLATNDNHYAGDPLLYHRFEQSGEYVLEIRDVRYKGNADWIYSIEINNRPFIANVHPTAATPGLATSLELVGYNLPNEARAILSLPPEAAPGVRWVSLNVGGMPANAFPVVSSPLPQIIELPAPESPPSQPAATPAAAGQQIAVPAMVSGRIAHPGELDRYSFQAKAGERFSFQVIARRAGSEMDSHLRITNGQAAVVAEVDDLQSYRINYSDSWLEDWAAPADGTYTIELRDLHLRGGPEYTYALEVSRSQPYFALELDTDKTQLAPGTAAPIFVRVSRKNGFAGPVQLAVEGLPPGVHATCGRILQEGRDGCIVLQASTDAPAGVANVRISGTANHPLPDGSPLALSAVAQPLQELYSPGGGRAHYPVEMHTVTVADPVDIHSVKLSNTALVLKPGEAQRIDVAIVRAPGFKGNVTLDVLYQHLEQPYGNSLPKGVMLDTASSKTLLTGDESQGFVTLRAAADAPAVDQQLIPVMAHVSVNFVMKMTYCGEPLTLSVIAQPVQAAFPAD